MPKETITVTIQAARATQVWFFRKPDSKWTILKTDKGKCLGVVAFEPKDGDCLKLEGEWKTSDRTGEQEFHFKAAQLDMPTDSRALLHYAASITKGIGPAKEEEIWKAFGEEWRQTHILTGIKGITADIHWHWKDTLSRLDENEQQTQAISFLIAHNCSLNMANAAWGRWEKSTVSIVDADPYELTKLPHYGFGDVDNGIRQMFGIETHDPRRLRAAIMYSVGKIVGEGNTIIAWDKTVEMASELVPDCKDQFEDAVRVLEEADRLRTLTDDLGLDLMLCREEDYKDESAIWKAFVT